jgi:hypothetical protein
MLNLKPSFIDPLDDLGVLLEALRLGEIHVVVDVVPAGEQDEQVLLSPIRCLLLLMAPTSGELPRGEVLEVMFIILERLLESGVVGRCDPMLSDCQDGRVERYGGLLDLDVEHALDGDVVVEQGQELLVLGRGDEGLSVHGGGRPGPDDVEEGRVFMLAVEEELVLVRGWLGEVFWVDMGGVRRRMEDASGEVVGVALHYTLGLGELGTEGRVREHGAWAEAEQGKLGDGHCGWFMSVLLAV